MSQTFDTVVTALRAAAEPTRLRLLVLLSRAELTVGEICDVVGQSQPRVSRHLKLLVDAGLLDRVREELFVYYRAPVDGPSRELLNHLLESIDATDPVLARDAERLARVMEQRRTRATSGEQADASNCGGVAELSALLTAELDARPIGRLLDVGTGAGHLLKLFASRATRAVGVDISTKALRVARSNLHGAGLSHCEFQRGDMYDLPFDDGAFDTVLVDRVLADARQPFAALTEAARMVSPDGRIVFIEDYDHLSDVVSGNPLHVVRDWFSSLGFACERIRPADTADAHLVIAIAHRSHTGQAAA